MSKRLKNYPDPMDVVNENGADALRLYLINSPVVRAQEFRFKEKGVKGVVKDVFLPWYHAMRFFIENARRYETQMTQMAQMDQSDDAKNDASLPSRFAYDGDVYANAVNLMDKWILQRLDWLIAYIKKVPTHINKPHENNTTTQHNTTQDNTRQHNTLYT